MGSLSDGHDEARNANRSQSHLADPEEGYSTLEEKQPEHSSSSDQPKPEGTEISSPQTLPPADQEPPSEDPVSSSSPDGDPSQAVERPYSSFTLWEKRLIIIGATMSALFSPLTAQIYFPALNLVADDFHVSISKINLTVTTYMIFQGITPMFIGGFADTAGRRPAYLICFVIYIAANIGVALCQNYAALLVLRCLQSAGSASTVALCQAVLADTITSAERGQYIGFTVLPTVLAPSLGPVLGGILAQYLGWRSIFWFLLIFAAIMLVIMLFFFPETCRKIVGDGSVRPHPVYRTIWQVIKDRRRKRKAQKKAIDDPDADLQRVTTNTPRPKLKLDFGNPFDSVLLLFEPVLGILLFYSGIVFAGFYAIATAMAEQMKTVYGLSEIEIGLMYLPMAGGSVAAALLIGPLMGRNYRRHARLMGMPLVRGRQDDLSNFPIERARLEVGLPLLALSTAVLFAWGWGFQYKASIAVPAVLLFLMGLGMVGFTNTAMVLVVDSEFSWP